MANTPNRLISALLVICLVAQSGLATLGPAEQLQVGRIATSYQPLWQEQALTSAPVWFLRFVLKRRFSSPSHRPSSFMAPESVYLRLLRWRERHQSVFKLVTKRDYAKVTALVESHALTGNDEVYALGFLARRRFLENKDSLRRQAMVGPVVPVLPILGLVNMLQPPASNMASGPMAGIIEALATINQNKWAVMDNAFDTLNSVGLENAIRLMTDHLSAETGRAPRSSEIAAAFGLDSTNSRILLNFFQANIQRTTGEKAKAMIAAIEKNRDMTIDQMHAIIAMHLELASFLRGRDVHRDKLMKELSGEILTSENLNRIVLGTLQIKNRWRGSARYLGIENAIRLFGNGHAPVAPLVSRPLGGLRLSDDAVGILAQANINTLDKLLSTPERDLYFTLMQSRVGEDKIAALFTQVAAALDMHGLTLQFQPGAIETLKLHHDKATIRIYFTLLDRRMTTLKDLNEKSAVWLDNTPIVARWHLSAVLSAFHKAGLYPDPWNAPVQILNFPIEEIGINPKNLRKLFINEVRGKTAPWIVNRLRIRPNKASAYIQAIADYDALFKKPELPTLEKEPGPSAAPAPDAPTGNDDVIQPIPGAGSEPEMIPTLPPAPVIDLPGPSMPPPAEAPAKKRHSKSGATDVLAIPEKEPGITTVTSWDEIANIVESRRGTNREVERVFVDLDDVLFYSMGEVASDEWVANRVNTVGFWRAKREWRQHEERMLENGFFSPGARDLSSKLKAMREAGVELVGWTARSKYDEDRTRKILKSLGLDLDTIIFGGSQKWRSLKTWSDKNRTRGSVLAIDNRIKNLERLGTEGGQAGNLEAIHFTRPAPWVDSSSESLLEDLKKALTRNQPKHALEYAINLLETSLHDPIDQRLQTYLFLGSLIEDLRSYGLSTDALVVSYLAKVADILFALQDRPETGTRKALREKLARDFFNLSAQNPETFSDFYSRGEIRFAKATRDEIEKGQDYKILLNATNMYAFLEPILAYIERDQPEVVVVAELGARPFKPLIEEFIAARGLKGKIRVLSLPISVKNVGDTEFEMQRWFDLGRHFHDRILPTAEDVLIGEMFSDWFQQGGLKGKKVLLVDDNVAAGHTARMTASLLGRLGASSLVVGAPFVFGEEKSLEFPVISSVHLPGHYVWLNLGAGRDSRPPFVVETEWEKDYSKAGLKRRARFSGPNPTVDTEAEKNFKDRSVTAFRKNMQSRSMDHSRSRLPTVQPLNLVNNLYQVGQVIAGTYANPSLLPPKIRTLPEEIPVGPLMLRQSRDPKTLADDYQKLLEKRWPPDQYFYPDFVSYIITENGEDKGRVNLLQLVDSEGRRSLVVQWIQPDFSLEMGIPQFMLELHKALSAVVHNEDYGYRMLLFPNQVHLISDRNAVRSYLVAKGVAYGPRFQDEEIDLMEVRALKTSGHVDRDSMTRAQWENLSRRIRQLVTLNLDDIERKVILEDLDAGHVNEEALELLNNAFDVSGANIYRIVGNRKTPQEEAKAQKWGRTIDEVGDFAIGQRENDILRDTKAIVQLGFVPFLGQQRFLNHLGERQTLLNSAVSAPENAPDWLRHFFNRNALMGSNIPDIRKWSDHVKLEFQALLALHSSPLDDFYRLPPGFFEDQEGEVRQRVLIQELMRIYGLHDINELLPRHFSGNGLSVLWYQSFGGKTENIARFLYPGQYGADEDKIHPLPLEGKRGNGTLSNEITGEGIDDFLNWFYEGKPLMAGRSLEFQANEAETLTFKHRQADKINRLLRLNLKQTGPMVLTSLIDANQGFVVCIFTKADYDKHDFSTPLKVFRLAPIQPGQGIKAGQGIYSAEDVNLGELDVLDFSDGNAHLVPGRAIRAKLNFVKGKEGLGVYIPIEYGNRPSGFFRQMGFYVSVERIRDLNLRQNSIIEDDGRQSFHPHDVVLRLEPHPKRGLSVRIYSAEPYDRGEKVLIDTYVYHPALHRVVQVNEPMQSMFAVAMGLQTGSVSVIAECPIRKGDKGQPAIEIKWTTSVVESKKIPRAILLPIPPDVVNRFREQGINLIGQKAVVSLQQDPLNYGAYLDAKLKWNDELIPISEYLSSNPNEPAQPAVLLERTFYDFAVGNMVNKRPVKAKAFSPNGTVLDNKTVRIQGPEGKYLVVDELPSSLVGRRIHFIPRFHPVFDTLVEVHDLEAWQNNKNRAPDALYRRDRIKERLVPLTPEDMALLKIGEFIPLEHLPELAAALGHDLVKLMYDIFPESFKGTSLEGVLGRFVTNNAKKRGRNRFNGGIDIPGGHTPQPPKGGDDPTPVPLQRVPTKQELDLIGTNLEKLFTANIRHPETIDGEEVILGEIEPGDVKDILGRLITRLAKLQYDRIYVDLQQRLIQSHGKDWTWKQAEQMLDLVIKEDLDEIPSSAETSFAIRRNALLKAQEEFHKDFEFVPQVEGLNPTVRLDLYQIRGVRRAVQQKQFLLADVRGLGKTLQALAAMATSKPRTVLIVAPKKALDIWAKEIHDSLGFSLEQLAELKRLEIPLPKEFHVQVMGGTRFEGTIAENIHITSVDSVNIPLELGHFKTLTLEEAPAVPDNTIHVCIINFEQAQKNQELIDQLTPDFLIVDEAHHLKNPESLRSKTVAPLARKMRDMDSEGHPRHVLFVTGTPMWNLPPDLWIHLDVLLKNFGIKWTRFKNLISRGDLKEIAESAELLSNIMERRQKTVLTDLPTLKIESIEVDMLRGTYTRNGIVERFSPKEMQSVRRQYALYGYLLEQLCTTPPSQGQASGAAGNLGIDMGGSSTLDDEFAAEDFRETYGRLGAVEIMRLSQVAVDPGLITGGDDESIKYLALDRVEKELLKQGEKVAVYSTFRGVVERVGTRYKRYNGNRKQYIHGDVAMTERARLLENFRHGPDQTLPLTLGTGGESISLLPVKTIVILDRPLVPGQLDQVIDRIHRRVREMRDKLPPGTVVKVIFINFAGSTSIDLYLQDLLALKQIYNEMMVESMFTQDMVNDLLSLESKLLSNLAKAYAEEKKAGLWVMSEDDKRYLNEVLPWDRAAEAFSPRAKDAQDVRNETHRFNFAPFWTASKTADILLHDDVFLSHLRPLAGGANWKMLVVGAGSESAPEVWQRTFPHLTNIGISNPTLTNFESSRNVASRLGRKTAQWVVGEDIGKTTFPDQEFEVIENGMLPFMDGAHKRETLNEAHRILKKNGLLILRARNAEFTEEFRNAAQESGFEVVLMENVQNFSNETDMRLGLEYGVDVVDAIDRISEPSQVLVLQKRGEPQAAPSSKRFSIISSKTRRDERLSHYLEGPLAQTAAYDEQNPMPLSDVDMGWIYNLRDAQVKDYAKTLAIPITFYRTGDRIEHPTFGIGTVREISNTLGRHRRITVDFPGRKLRGKTKYFYFPNEDPDFQPVVDSGSWWPGNRVYTHWLAWMTELVVPIGIVWFLSWVLGSSLSPGDAFGSALKAAAAAAIFRLGHVPAILINPAYKRHPEFRGLKALTFGTFVSAFFFFYAGENLLDFAFVVTALSTLAGHFKINLKDLMPSRVFSRTRARGQQLAQQA